MAWLAKMDAKATCWPAPAHWGYVAFKWFLVILGGLGLINNFLEKWGTTATVWFLAMPFVWGVWRAWPTDPPSTLPRQSPD
jgi:hypothetical protein